MVINRPFGSKTNRLDGYTVFRDEDQCRAWIACLEENLGQARAALDAIVSEKSCAVESEQKPAAG